VFLASKARFIFLVLRNARYVLNCLGNLEKPPDNYKMPGGF
jgi:hypothetical protein